MVKSFKYLISHCCRCSVWFCQLFSSDLWWVRTPPAVPSAVLIINVKEGGSGWAYVVTRRHVTISDFLCDYNVLWALCFINSCLLNTNLHIAKDGHRRSNTESVNFCSNHLLSLLGLWCFWDSSIHFGGYWCINFFAAEKVAPTMGPRVSEKTPILAIVVGLIIAVIVVVAVTVR